MEVRDFRKPIAWSAAAAAAGILIYLLFVPPVLGVANNGDFERIMGLSGLDYADPHESYADRYFAYAHQYYAYGHVLRGGYVTTQILLTTVAGWIGHLFSWNRFDIRVLGGCYAFFLLLSLWLIVRHAPNLNGRGPTAASAALLGGFAVFVFADVAYAAYFQSLFGEPYAFVAMLLAVAAVFALADAERPSGRMFALFVGAAFAVLSSKIQNAPLGFPFALLAWRMRGLRADKRWRKQVASGAVVLAAGAALLLAAVPDGLRHINLYQSIFSGILKDSPTPEQDLKELGIPVRYAVLKGTNYFQPDTAIPQSDPTLRREVLDRLGHKDIILFYLKHPDRFVRKLEVAADNGVSIRPYYLGNYDKSAGKPPGALSQSFSGWSRFKHDVLPHSLGWVLGFYLLYAAALVLMWIRARTLKTRLLAEALAAVAVSGAFSFAIPLIGDGEADLGKHLFMFNVCSDMMLVSAASAIVYAAVRAAAALRGRMARGSVPG
jgi:hypothetical protein